MRERLQSLGNGPKGVARKARPWRDSANARPRLCGEAKPRGRAARRADSTLAARRADSTLAA
jgi:hypothetical protein